MNTWNRHIHTDTQNVHNVHKTYIYIYIKHRNPETQKTRLSSGTKLFITFWVKRFFDMRREKDTIFLCWLFHLHPLSRATPATRQRRASESQPPSFRGRKSTNRLFSNLSPRFRYVTSFTSLLSHFFIWDFYCDISEWHVHSARAWTPALMFAPNEPMH